MSATLDAGVRDQRRDSLSLAWKLPIVMTGGIAAALTVLLVSTYVVLRGRAEARTRDRMSHAVIELAREVDQALTEREKQFRDIAVQDAVRRALLDALRRAPVDTLTLRR